MKLNFYQKKQHQNIYNRNLLSRFNLHMEGDGGDGGGGGGDDTFTKEQLDAAVADAVKTATERAQADAESKNKGLLDDLKKVKGQLKSFDGLDPEQIRKVMETINQSEEATLISEGKLDEVIQRRTDTMRAGFEEQINTLKTQNEELVGDATNYKTLYERRVMSDEIREEAIKAGARPEALDDIVRRGADTFTLSEDGKLEARDSQGNLIKDADDYILTPERFITSLKKSSPHYWPESKGGGAGGTGDDSRTDLERELQEASAAGDQVRYQKIRKKMMEAK